MCSIKNAYDQFEINSIFDDQANVRVDDDTSTIDGFSAANPVRKKFDNLNDSVEIVDSSDEDDLEIDKINTKSYGTTSVVACDMDMNTSELNCVVEIDDDESNTDVSQTNLREGESQKNDLQSKNYNHDDSSVDVANNLMAKGKSPVEKEPSTIPKQFSCEYCRFSSIYKKSLVRHMLLHVRKKNIIVVFIIKRTQDRSN